MINFDFECKTKLYFGTKKEEEIGNIVSSYGFSNVLIVIGKNSVKKSGLLDSVLNKLNEKQINYTLLEGVRANPAIDLVLEGVKLAREKQIDLILAIGGGSVIDTAKSIAVGYYYEGNPFDFNLHKLKPIKALPIGCILTISAAGSEMSTSCVIQDDETQVKSGFNSELIRPLFAVENPELTFTVDKKQTAFGIVDILMHTVERYFCYSEDDSLCDSFAEGLMKTTMAAGTKTLQNPNDFNSRATLMLCSSLSHNGITNIGKKYVLAVHALEHGLSGLYPEIAHAEGLAVLWASWARVYINENLDKFDRFARNVFDLRLEDKLENAKAGIDAMEQYFASLGLNISLSSLREGNVDIDKLVYAFSPDGTRLVAHHKKPIDTKIARQIYELAYARKEVK
jgi:alcohol dehydrogenase YqhD (iron-dependent ADH family)